MKISVIIPAHNEEKTIDVIIKRVMAVDIDKEIIVVDDGSTDGTKEKLLQMNENGEIKAFSHNENLGKGAAIRTALEHIQGDIVIIQDADLEYNPGEYLQLIEPIIDGRADVVYGSRFLGGPHRVLFFWHYVGNKILTILSNMVTNLNLTDMETGYKAFRSHVVKNLQIKSNRFGFEPEITVKIAKGNFKIYEVPISYSGRDYSEGKKITWKDGVAAVYWILRFRLWD